MQLRFKTACITIVGLFCCFAKSFAETVPAPHGQLEDPLFRVGSEVIHRKDINPPDEEIKRYKAEDNPIAFNNWHWSYRTEMAFGLVNKKLEEAFCEHADCVPDEKYVAEWKTLMENQMRDMQLKSGHSQKALDKEAMARVEALFGGPPSQWQENKALYEHYGGKVIRGNLGYYVPMEARLRLFHEMEDKGGLEFYDPEVRNGVMEYFKRWMTGAIETGEKFQKEEGMRHPWEYPWWSGETMRQKIDGKDIL